MVKTDHQQVDFVFVNKMNDRIDFFPIEQVGRNLHALLRCFFTDLGLQVRIELATIFAELLKDRGIARNSIGRIRRKLLCHGDGMQGHAERGCQTEGRCQGPSCLRRFVIGCGNIPKYGTSLLRCAALGLARQD